MAQRHPRDEGRIQPAAFEPLDGKPRRRRLRTGLLFLVLVLVAVVLVLWFLFTARSLILATEPPNASISLSGGVVIPLGDRYLLRPGTYRLEARSEGYRPLERPIRVGEAGSQRLDLRLEKLPGRLEVTADPPGTRVFLDGEEQGTTPLTLASVPAGAHRLAFRHDRYFSAQRTMDIEGRGRTQQLNVALEPAWGTALLTSEPSGARVAIGDRELGRTPLEAQVLASGETLQFSLSGHKDRQLELAVPAGTRVEPPVVELEPADGHVRVASRPAGAAVTVDGEYRGQTPLELALAPGDARRLTLFLEGYERAARSLTVKPGEQRAVEVELEPRLGAVQVTSEPAGAALYVNGERRGSAGDTLRLPARPQRVEAKLSGYAPAEKTVIPDPERRQVVEFRLLTEAQAAWRDTPTQLESAGGQTLLRFRPGATFTMGASRREQGRRANEVSRRVRLERPFYLATAPVTNAQFKRFRAGHSSSHRGGKTLDFHSQPVVAVSWLDAVRYCNWLSEKEGLPPFYNLGEEGVESINPQATGYRLPTEAEWAWAARTTPDGDLRKFAWGDGLPPPPGSVNIADASAAGITAPVLGEYRDDHPVSAPVTRFSANDKGLYGLGHNVSEWVHDHYSIEPTLGGKALVDPLGPDTGELRVIRGASWRHASITELRLAFRDYGLEPRPDLGFRVARYIQPTEGGR